MNSTANAADRNVQAQTAQIIPFNFQARKVRTLLIDGAPWFVAADVCGILGLSNTTKALYSLDEDERSNFKLGRQGAANIINESGLYTLILRCDDAIKKGSRAHTFRKWVTAEVLPAIRKRGRYEDGSDKMVTLMDELGVNELNVIKGLIRDKSRAVAVEKRQGFQLAMHNRLHTRFNVQRTELIPADQFEVACNFIAAYALEGEFLAADEPQSARLDIDFTVAKWVAENPANFSGAATGLGDRIDLPVRAVAGISMNSPTYALLKILEDAGYEIEACRLELVALKDHAQVMHGVMDNLHRALDNTLGRSKVWPCRTKRASA